MTRRMIRRTSVVALAVLLALAAMTGVAAAHKSGESYVYLDVFDSTIEGELHYPVEELNDVLGVNIPNDPDEALDWAGTNAGLILDYSADHFAMAGVDGSEWPIVYGELDSLDGRDGAYLIATFEVDQEFAESPRQFVVTYDAIVHARSDRAALLAIATDFGSGTFKNEADMLLRFSADNPTQTVDLGDTSFWKGMTAVIDLGVEHIRIGADHILFIVALVLPSVLVFSRGPGWEPSPRVGSSLWRVLKIVTMFTVAHSITLTLGGLGIIELPSALVESVIAISIILAALHNIRPVLVNREWIIAFGFGLIHGFGFAGLLADLGLTQSRRLVSLFGFNLGIEIGQAVIILLVFPALYLARRTKAYLPAMYAGSVLLILVAAVWALERVFSIDLGTEWVFDRATVWPRQLILVAILYGLAIYAYRKGRRNDDLLPLPSVTDAPQPAVAVAEA